MGFTYSAMIVELVIIIFGAICCCTNSDPIFDENYVATWGFDHLKNHNSNMEIFLASDGGAGFESKKSYGSGFITLRIKVPGNDSGGVVTTFYLVTTTDESHRNELDIEFLGNRPGRPYTLQTNIYVNGEGGREHRTYLWFDPALDFHTYKILWNQFHIVVSPLSFFADNIPIRYFKNNIAGVSYPTRPMKVEASIWDGSDWATDGGKTKVDYNHAPFRAFYKDFQINGCPIDEHSVNVEPCYSDEYWWNHNRYRELNPSEQRAYTIVKHNYVWYDYCNDRKNHPIPPPECAYQ